MTSMRSVVLALSYWRVLNSINQRCNNHFAYFRFMCIAVWWFTQSRVFHFCICLVLIVEVTRSNLLLFVVNLGRCLKWPSIGAVYLSASRTFMWTASYGVGLDCISSMLATRVGAVVLQVRMFISTVWLSELVFEACRLPCCVDNSLQM